MSSIHTLMEFSQYASKPFPVFLSRRAMINTGKDQVRAYALLPYSNRKYSQVIQIVGACIQGELGNAEKKALSLLLQFQPDFIMDMSDTELRKWYIRATSKTQKVGKGNVSSAFIEAAVAENGKRWGGCDGKSMVINLVSTLLYTINYYIIAPTANHYASLLGLDGAYGATLIGASSFSAIFAAFLYSVWFTCSSFRSALAFSALCPLIGNL